MDVEITETKPFDVIGARLLIPETDEPEPELSIVIPVYDEEVTIERFLRWCHEGIANAQVKAEILIVDSSKDNTAQLAFQNGARVLCVPKRGLGHAYMDAIPFIRGKWVIMGDSDCTYDFRELKPWIEKFRAGYEFIIGSRFKGTIEKDAMPKLHQYFGTPLMTAALNHIYKTNFSDIHCGMRGCTTDALKRMHLRSTSWEYASEMIVKAVHLRLRTTEIPINFYKDDARRVSHHKRIGWQSPWIAGWINMREIFTYRADWFLLAPGVFFATMGAVCLAGTLIYPVTEALLFAAFSILLGLFMFAQGAVARTLYDFTGTGSRKWMRAYSFNRSVLISCIVFSVGIAFGLASGGDIYDFNSLRFLVLGLLGIIGSFVNFTTTLIMIAIIRVRFRSRRPPAHE